MIEVTLTIRLESGKELILTVEEAVQLYDKLGHMFQ